jgi:hypothetical protein
VPRLLGTKKNSIIKEVLWAVSNIVGGTELQAQLAIDKGAVKHVVDVAQRETGAALLKEAAIVLNNVIEKLGSSAARYLCEIGGVTAVRRMLEVRALAGIVQPTLQAYLGMLKAAIEEPVEGFSTAIGLKALDLDIDEEDDELVDLLEKCLVEESRFRVS